MATQRLIAAGKGFGGEGDWKTAALVRARGIFAIKPSGVVHAELKPAGLVLDPTDLPAVPVNRPALFTWRKTAAKAVRPGCLLQAGGSGLRGGAFAAVVFSFLP